MFFKLIEMLIVLIVVLKFFNIFPEPISKRHLRFDVSVAVLLKMLTYAHVCCAFSSACALTSNLI
jgi:hypothetical protein